MEINISSRQTTHPISLAVTQDVCISFEPEEFRILGWTLLILRATHSIFIIVDTVTRYIEKLRVRQNVRAQLLISGVAHSVERFDNHLGLHIELQRKTSDCW